VSDEFLCQDLEAKLFNWFAGRLDASIIKRSSEMEAIPTKETAEKHALAKYIADYIMEEQERGNVDIDKWVVLEAMESFEGGAR
jgi:hypothetical protein